MKSQRQTKPKGAELDSDGIWSNQPLQPVNQTGIHWRLCSIPELVANPGVMLSHGTCCTKYTFGAVFGAVQPQPGDRFLSILPSWHAYERT